MSAEQHREEWVDAARCLAMAVIMWQHTGNAPGWAWLPVGGALALFFLLAGYFMPHSAGRAAARGLRLGVAWLLWSLISLALYRAAQPSEPWSWARAFGLGGESAYNTPLWFLKDLCVYQLLLAGLMRLGLLPRYKWLLLALLAGFTYAAEPAQHEALRFDWLIVVVLGLCMQGITPGELHERLGAHAPMVVGAVALLLAQQLCYPALLREQGWSGHVCSLPMASLACAVLMLLAGVGLLRHVPRVARLLARPGRRMLFIYAAHSPAFAPFYYAELPAWARVGIMLALLPALTGVCAWLEHFFPRAMQLLTARRS